METKWERYGFGMEFGADAKLHIGGRERAKWRVESRRSRLYRDTTGEEHWLDLVENELMWEGQKIGRVPKPEAGALRSQTVAVGSVTLHPALLGQKGLQPSSPSP